MLKKNESKVLGALRITKVSEAAPGASAYKIEGEAFAEGLTVGRDKWYTRKAVEAAAAEKAFDGVPMFLNHATEREEYERPERDIRDMVAKVVRTWAQEADGKMRLMFEALIHGSPVCPAGTLREWFHGLMAAGVTPEVSQHSWIEGQSAEVEGYPVFVVERIAKAESIDFVTFGNAGGIITAAEALKGKAPQPITESKKGGQQMTIKEILEALSKDAELKAELVAALTSESKSAEAVKAAEAARDEAIKAKEAAEKEVQAMKLDAHKKEVIESAKAKVKESKLPEPTEKRVLESLESIAITLETKKDAIEKDVDAIVAKEKAYLESVTKVKVFGNGEEQHEEVGEGLTAQEALEAANKLFETKKKED